MSSTKRSCLKVKVTMGMSVATCPLGNLLAVLCCLLSCWAGWGAGAAQEAFPVSPEHLPISRMAVHPQSGHVYVGANNYVARLSPDLRLVDSVQLGNDSSENVTSDSRQVRILEIFPDLERLLVCWQESDCVCRTLSLHNISVTEETRMENLTCSEHSVAVLPPKREVGMKGAGSMLLAAPWLQTAPVLSFLTLNVTSLESSLLFASTTGVSHVYVQPSYSYNIAFVHGFVYQDFIYLVTVRDDQLKSPKRKVSKISRVCHNCSSVMPYVEVDVHCSDNGKIYSIATAARLARIPSNSNSTTDVLIVSFVESHEALMNPTTRSAVCVYPMLNVQNVMHGIILHGDLYKVTPAYWIKIDHKNHTNLTEVCKGPFTAKSGDENAMRELGGKTVLHLPETLVTSIQSVDLQVTTTVSRGEVILLTTSRGQLLQYNVTDTNYHITWGLGRSYNLTSTFRLWSDSSIHEDNIYVSTNDTVYRENWALFPEYQNCEACVIDSPMRHWCDGRCQLRGSHTCKESWQERTCPPEISQIKPTGGLKNGGTTLTMLGERLGTSNTSVEVKVCGNKCALVSVNLTKVVCLTPPAQRDRFQCNVSIRVNEINSASSKVNIRGTAWAQQNFTYQDPVLTTLKPHRGPRSGGTHLTITSTGLHPGDDVMVFLGPHAQCLHARPSETEITCTTSSLEEEAQLPMFVSVTVAVGGLNFTGNTSFKYEEDPDITSIEPRRSFSSGGLNITVTGTNLDVIARPRMGLKTPGASSEEANATELCTVNNGAVTMTCPSPNASGVAQDGKAEIFFLMDGVERLNNFSAFRPDLSVMEVPPDPTPGKPPVSVDSRNGRKLELEITGLKGVVTKDQISVTVGQVPCENVEISDTHVSCDVQARPETDPENKNGSTAAVVIKIGRLELKLGEVQLKPDPPERTILTTEVSIGIGVAAVVVVLLCLCVCYLCLRPRSGSHKCEIEGHSMTSNTEMVKIVDPAKIKLVETSNLLIKKDHLQLGECVGEGNFGCVYVGHLTREGSSVKVAVKTLREEDSQSVNLNDFLDEALRMKDFKDPNVLNLLGIAFVEGSMPHVVLPFMERGDLHSFVTDWHNEVTVPEIIKFGRDIASGMAYLSSLKFVHRDLAARNCMLESDLRVRVADFGLGRDIYEKGYYHSDNKKKLPIRWMSIESIDRGTYSTKSDVWSLGVVLWELFTRGVTPYPGVDGWDIARFLRAGRRLEQPWFCPTSVYDLMMRCWMEEPSSRPDFPEIRECLDQIHAIQESNADQSGIYVALGECARYQNMAGASGSYFILEDQSQPSSPGSHAPSSPVGYAPLQVTTSMANPQGDYSGLISGAPGPSYCHDLPPPDFPDPPPSAFPDPPPPDFPASSTAPLSGGGSSVYANQKQTVCPLPPQHAFSDLPPPDFPDPPPPAFPSSSAVPVSGGGSSVYANQGHTVSAVPVSVGGSSVYANQGHTVSAVPVFGGGSSVYANQKHTVCPIPPHHASPNPQPPAFPDPQPPAFPDPPPPSQLDPLPSLEAAYQDQPSASYIPGLKQTPSPPPPTTQTVTIPVTQPATRRVCKMSTFSAPKPS